jgi:diketogulonate reductase-like aldo/keto reductase
MASSNAVTLNDGNVMPLLGLGTYIAAHHSEKEKSQVYQATKDALQAGYRHIDTAWIYGIEDQVGRAIRECVEEGLFKREELFVTTKLWLSYFGKDHVKVGIKESLEKLGLDYVDLFLIHWPCAVKLVEGKPLSFDKGFDNEINIYTETWPQMEELKRSGLAKSIGVSNYNSQQLTELLKVATIKPAINQVESHPLLSQKKLIEFCRQNSIEVTAYSPLGGSPIDPNDKAQLDPRTELFGSELVRKLAAKYHKQVGHILLRFQIDRGVVVIPKSVTKSRIVDNFNVFDFKLEASEIEALEGLNRNMRYADPRFFKASIYYPFAEGVEF